MNIYISKDNEQLDLDFIHGFLTRSYWASGRTKEDVQVTIHHSICYGVYQDHVQIGFGRVISDRRVFAYLMDVFIAEEHRGNGYGCYLLKYIMEDQELKAVKKWMLATRDAHALYRRLGFKELEYPDRIMEKIMKL